MDALHAILLGIIEGLTEFLPISSTAHLLVAQDVIGFRDEAELFTVVVQLGAIAAAAWYFRHDLTRIVQMALKRDRPTLLFARNVLLALFPAGLLGLVVEKTVGVPTSLTLIACMLIVGGLAFLAIEHYVKLAKPSQTPIEQTVTGRQAAYIGLGQTLALIPGVSRSGATIMSGLLAGLDRRMATAFSFYLSIPIMLGASAVKLMDDYSQLEYVTGGGTGLALGLTAAFISALIAIHWLLKYVANHSFKIFAWYRIILGLLLLVYTYAK
jgi:undecaprenyl-diphosphatase